jgi:indolepyruvate ferredoxin oxidoreductase beta subunit
MKCDIILSGVGGQGVLSVAAIIGRAAVAEGWNAKQSEVHGMAQRGGAVLAHLRLSTDPIASDLIPKGAADLVLSLEPLESLRYLAFLAPGGTLVTASNPLVNIPDYPELEGLLARIRLLPHAIVVDAEKLALESGDVQTVNTVMVGAAAHLLPFKPETLLAAVRQTWKAKGEFALGANLAAFDAGRQVPV